MNYKSFMRSNSPAGKSTLTKLIALLSLLLTVGLIINQPAARMQEILIQSDSVTLDNEPYVAGQVIVGLNEGFTIDQIAAMYGLDPVPVSQIGLPPSYLMRIIDGSTVEQKVAQLAADLLRVDYAEPNFKVSAPEASRPTWSVGDSFAPVAAGRKSSGGQWAKSTIRLDEAHQVTRGAGIVVAVLDTGVDFNHPLFAGRIAPGGYDFIGQDNDPSEEGNTDVGPFGHGTHVAGLILMVAPEAKIMPIRVLNVQGRTDAFTVARAVEHAIAQGADVVNLSISSPNSLQVVQKVFYELLDGPDEEEGMPLVGAVAVVAAGNTGGAAFEYPAAVSRLNRDGRCVLSIAASNRDDVLASFSTRGSWVSVMAPGERIIGPVPFNRYGNWSGTSMAAPLAAGQAALVRARNPLAEPKDVVSHIKSNSVSIPGQMRRIDVMRSLINIIPPDDRMQEIKTKR